MWVNNVSEPVYVRVGIEYIASRNWLVNGSLPQLRVNIVEERHDGNLRKE